MEPVSMMLPNWVWRAHWTCRFMWNMRSWCLGGNNRKNEEFDRIEFTFATWKLVVLLWRNMSLEHTHTVIPLHAYHNAHIFIRFSEKHTAHFSSYSNCRLLLLCDVCGSEASLRNMKQSVRVSASEVLPEKKRLWNRIPEERLDPTHHEVSPHHTSCRKCMRRFSDIVVNKNVDTLFETW